MNIKEIIQRLKNAMDDARGQESHFESWLTQNEGICDAIDALKELDKTEQEPVAFPRQVGDSTWTVDTGFIWRVKHTIDPDTPHDFTPSEEQIETVLLSLEKIPSSLYTTPPQRKPLPYEKVYELWLARFDTNEYDDVFMNFARAIEAAHGIKEKNNG